MSAKENAVEAVAVEETALVEEPHIMIDDERVPMSEAFPPIEDETYIVFDDEKGKRRRMRRAKYEGR